MDATTAYAQEGTGPFDERPRFVMACEEVDESFPVICERFGISRQNGYKWLARFEERRVGRAC